VTEPIASPPPAGFSRHFLLRFFFWALSGDAISKVAVLCTNIIAVRSLEPIEFGLYVGLWATAILSASLWDVGVSTLLTRELAANRLSPRQAAVQALRLRVKTSGIWFLAFLAASAVLLRGDRISIATVLIFGGASAAFASHAILLAMLRARFRFRTAAGALVTGRWFTAALSLLALPTIEVGEPLEVLAAALLGGETVTVALALAAVIRESRRLPSPMPRVAASTLTLRAAIPFAANSILILSYNRFDVVLLGALASTHQLSYYAPASRMQDALLIVGSAIGTVALPVISRAASSAAGLRTVQNLVKRFIVMALVLSIPVTVICFVYAAEIVTTVMGAEYDGAILPAQVLVWSLPFSAVTTPLLAGLAGTRHAVDTTKAFVAAFIVAALLHLSLDWWWGAMGGAVASLAREPAALIAALVYARRAGVFALRSERAAAAEGTAASGALR